LVVALGYLIAASVCWAQRRGNRVCCDHFAVSPFVDPVPRTDRKAKDYWYRGQHIAEESPPLLVAAAGWFFLVGMPIVVYLLSRSSS
jgi:hypothetical protein